MKTLDERRTLHLQLQSHQHQRQAEIELALHEQFRAFSVSLKRSIQALYRTDLKWYAERWVVKGPSKTSMSECLLILKRDRQRQIDHLKEAWAADFSERKALWLGV
jgi:hypothetical protein